MEQTWSTPSLKNVGHALLHQGDKGRFRAVYVLVAGRLKTIAMWLCYTIWYTSTPNIG